LSLASPSPWPRSAWALAAVSTDWLSDSSGP
jgi:hypothetical protein